MKLVTDYLERASQFEQMAAETDDAALKQQLLGQSEAYWKPATKRAAALGLPAPVRPSAKTGSGSP